MSFRFLLLLRPSNLQLRNMPLFLLSKGPQYDYIQAESLLSCSLSIRGLACKFEVEKGALLAVSCSRNLPVRMGSIGVGFEH